ncbi:MAG: cytochrome c maturation protein CcmE [Anaerolineaceae bacterium]|jgi:cytochrome c-type biogenesis protein CcmE|nr:cytochrome c maturation protein CcmE [Anaerolineaceae bacterium]
MEMTAPARPASQGRTKFIIGGLLILAAVVYLIVSSTQSGSQYFLTVEELNNRAAEMAGRDVRVSGAVLGDSIQYDADTLHLEFSVANIPGDTAEIDRLGGMAAVLHQASLDTSLPRLRVVYNGVRPDLLKNEAQAIMTGKLGDDGVFYADELLLKCPTRYEDAVPDQVES